MQLTKDITYFITKDGSVKTLNSVNLEDTGIKLLVYDRTSPKGLSVLPADQVASVLTRYSKEYNERLKSFIQFLFLELQDDIELYEYMMAIWNGDTKTSQMLYDENCALPDGMNEYLQDLILNNIYEDDDVVRYFYEVYYMQELVYDKYCEDWLFANSGIIREHNITDSKEI